MKLKVDPHSDIPIYKQMVAAIILAIESEELDVGAKLPSIREMSAQLKINPNTTAKVYRELELRGFIDSKPGSGCFVLPKDEEASAAAKTARLQEIFDKMLGEAKSHQVDEQDLIAFLKLRTSS